MTATPLVVAGALANKPGNGGEAWVRMEWVAGLRRLGFDVWFLEQIDRGNLLDGADRSGGRPAPTAFFEEVVRRFGLEDRAALLDDRGRGVVGQDARTLEEVAAEAALLVNISGNLSVQPLFDRFRRRAFVDLDPGYTQLWHTAGLDEARLPGHDLFFTVGLNIGSTGCTIPDGGIHWRPLPPPVLLDEWPVRGDADPRFTTVASWRGSFGTLEHEGRTLGSKAHEFRRFLELPRHVPAPLEIALDIHPGDRRDLVALQEHGWRIVDPTGVASSPDAYREYIQGSGAEFSVAQGMYVATGSGWFSDRTARYLASGKPALVQDTGFSVHYAGDQGLVAFRTLEEAAAGARRIARDYEAHCAAARELAEAQFDSDAVLGALVDEAGVAP